MGIEAIIAPLGLITQPNKLGVYAPGALSQAVGCCMRSPNLLSRMPDFVSYNASPFFSSSPLPHFLFASDSQLVHLTFDTVSGLWELTFVSGSNKFGNILNTSLFIDVPQFDQTGRINVTRQRERLLFNSDNGIMIVDSVAPTSNATAKPRYAGLPALGPAVTPVTTGNPGALASGFVTSLCVTLRRVYADGYEVVSPPSSPVYCAAGSLVASDISIFVQWDDYSALVAGVGYVQAGDYIDVYRTPQQPVDTSLGSTFRLSTSHIVTTAEAAAFGATFIDTTPDIALLDELYTNPGQQTAEGIKLPPPLAKCLTTYRGYTFYSNTTSAASLAIKAPHGFSLNLPTTGLYLRKNGIGVRGFTATFTSTSNVLTAISATDIVGLAIGQRITDAALTFGSGIITAVGATSVTVNSAAVSNVTKATSSIDIIIVNVNGTGDASIPVSSWAVMPAINASFNGLSIFATSIDPPETITGVPAGDNYSPRGFVISTQRAGVGPFTVRASNGPNYVPPLPITSATPLSVVPDVEPNSTSWSEQGQPEAVPPFNAITVGSGTIQATVSTRDGIYFFCSDGLWVLVGTGGSAGRGFDWNIRQLDSTLSIAGPHACCVLRDTVYAYTNRGMVGISPKGIQENISAGRVNDLLPGPPFALNNNIQMASNETEDEIWLGIISGAAMTLYVYNTLTNAWTVSLTAGGNSLRSIPCYARYLQEMGLIDGTAAYSQAAAQFQAITVDYQPVYDGDPTVINQWQDMTLVCDASVDVNMSVALRYNGTTGQNQTLRNQLGDVRGTWCIPRNAPAVSNSFAPGFRVATSPSQDLRLYGVILRSEQLTTQRKQR